MPTGTSPFMLIARINNVFTRFEGFIPSHVKDKIDNECSYQIPDADFAIRKLTQKKRDDLKVKYGDAAKFMSVPAPWDGKQRFFKKKSNVIPSGLMGRVKAILNAEGVPFTVIDERGISGTKEPPPKTLDLSLHGFTPRDYQDEATDEAVLRQRGIVYLATGGGKTEIIAMILRALGRPAIVLIHRETIFRQLVERLSMRLGVPVGAVGGGVYNPQPITVAMVQTVTQPRFIPFLQMFPVVVVDECHHTPASTIYSILQNCTQGFFRYGFTATPWRDDMAEMFIEAAFAGFICKLGPSELIERGYLTKPKVVFMETDHTPQWDLLSWQAQYSKCVIENHFRNRLIVDVANRFKSMGKTTLVAVTQIRHGKALLKLLNSTYPSVRAKFIKGEDESDDKQNTLKSLDRRQLDVVIATSVFGEGIDVPSLDALINAKAQDSQIDTIQLIGRALRPSPSKKFAYFIDFMDRQTYTRGHSLKRYRLLKQEPKFDVNSVKTMADLDKILNDEKGLL